MDFLPPRNDLQTILALIKRQVEGAFTSVVEKDTFKVKVTNDKVLYSYFNLVVKKFESLITAITSLPKVDRVIGLFRNELFTELRTLSANNIFKVKVEETQKLEEQITTLAIKLDLLIAAVGGVSQVGEKGSAVSTEITKKLEEVKTALKAIKLDLPKIQKVEITNPIENKDIVSTLLDVKKAVQALKLSVSIPEQKEIKLPAFPTTINVKEGKEIIDTLKLLQDSLDTLPTRMPRLDLPDKLQVDVMSAPPQKYPLPVTNMNINPLRGYPKSTNVTIGTTATGLPNTPLAYRRSLVVYNNSTQTLYVGGSDVTTTNGMIVPPSSYSPAMDAGPRLIVYGIVASGSADIRVLELSNENVGG